MLAVTLVAELNGVTNLLPTDTPETPFFYTFTIQCTSCRETHPNPISISRHETHEQSGSRGEANFVWRCKNCKREHSAGIKEAPRAVEARNEEVRRQTVIEVDCRGLDLVEFRPEGDWQAVSSLDGSSTKFEGIDLTEGEWYDYDEKAGEEVSIKDMTWEIRRA